MTTYDTLPGIKLVDIKNKNKKPNLILIGGLHRHSVRRIRPHASFPRHRHRVDCHHLLHFKVQTAMIHLVPLLFASSNAITSEYAPRTHKQNPFIQHTYIFEEITLIHSIQIQNSGFRNETYRRCRSSKESYSFHRNSSYLQHPAAVPHH